MDGKGTALAISRVGRRMVECLAVMDRNATCREIDHHRLCFTHLIAQIKEGVRRFCAAMFHGLKVGAGQELHGAVVHIDIVQREPATDQIRRCAAPVSIILVPEDGAAVAGFSLTREERALQADLRRLLSSHEDRLKSILMGRPPKVEAKPPPGPGLKVVRFLQAVPAIMGIDMKTYGPFSPEDIASIPAENAENLIRRGIAKEVEIPG